MQSLLSPRSLFLIALGSVAGCSSSSDKVIEDPQPVALIDDATPEFDGALLCGYTPVVGSPEPAFDRYCSGEPECAQAIVGPCESCTCLGGKCVGFQGAGAACDAGPVIPCGTLSCDPASQYCQLSLAPGDALDGGAIENAACLPLPQCDGATGCDCIAPSANAALACECSAELGLTIRCSAR